MNTRSTLKMGVMAAVVLVMLAGPARAQRGFDKPPAPAPAKPLQVPAFAEASLPNGIRIVVAERRGLPLVTAMVLVEAGSLLDPPGKSGLASLSYTLMGKGSKRGGQEQDAASIAIAAETLGGSLEVDSGARSGRIAMTVPANRLADSLALMANVIRAPTFPDEELERSRAQILDAIKLNLSDPAALAGLLGRRLYWGETPGGAVTTPASLQRIRREDVVAFHRLQVRPDRVTLVLAGGCGPARRPRAGREVLRQLEAEPHGRAAGAAGAAQADGRHQPAAGPAWRRAGRGHRAGALCGLQQRTRAARRLARRRGGQRRAGRGLLLAHQPGGAHQARPELRRQQRHRDGARRRHADDLRPDQECQHRRGRDAAARRDPEAGGRRTCRRPSWPRAPPCWWGISAASWRRPRASRPPPPTR